MTVEEKLRGIFAQELALDHNEITTALSYNSIPEWDSVAHMHVIMAIEEAFDITFDDTEIGNLTNFGKIQNYLEKVLHTPSDA